MSVSMNCQGSLSPSGLRPSGERLAWQFMETHTVLGWVTAWEHWVLLASDFFCKVSHFCFSARLDVNNLVKILIWKGLVRFPDASIFVTLTAKECTSYRQDLELRLLPQRKLDKQFKFSIGVSHTRKSLVKGERFIRGCVKGLS